ncbi:MAG: glycoside hydrolase family 57 protein [Candidatus Sumerlaeaceae bacterium]
MSNSHPVHVAVLWHMHQPYYKDRRSGKYLMPWVRLHGVKDYLDMVELLKEFPDIRMNFNLVPSLVEQIQDFAVNGATDLVWDLSRRPAAALNETERLFILQKFFHAHPETMIRPYPRYQELYDKRGWAKSDAEFNRALHYFTEADFRDLQVWYNLTWIDPLHREHDSALRDLIAKDRDFTDDDKEVVLQAHRRLCGRIVPAYREAEAREQIELSCTPFYHPIMPLLVDTNLASIARPSTHLPRQRFQHPEDAESQLRNAVEFHEKTFGRRPCGLWPSEGSVAPELLPMLKRQGLQWIATDEEILCASVGEVVLRSVSGTVQNRELLYQPYWAEHEGNKIAVLFRDHYLSDLIGFQYGGWPAEDAAQDLLSRLEEIGRAHGDPERPLLVSIILDGENCWEHYADDGLPFLRKLYSYLSHSQYVRTTRICDYLEHYPPQRTLPRLHAGSWINHDFGIWIGHKEDNQSWDYLHEVRELVEHHIEMHGSELSREQIDAAWKEIYIAEGSDWNWWYGEDHSSGMDEEFDQLYRDHLMAACQSVGLQPPAFLLIPIKVRQSTATHVLLPRAFLNPTIDGRDTSFFEWFAAGRYDPAMGGGAMHQAQHLIDRIYFAFNSDTLFFRVDAKQLLIQEHENEKVHLRINVIMPATWQLSIPVQSNLRRPPSCMLEKFPEMLVQELSDGTRTNMPFNGQIGAGSIVEAAIPFTDLGLVAGDELYFYVGVHVDGREVERCPVRAPLQVQIPQADFETRMWVV